MAEERNVKELGTVSRVNENMLATIKRKSAHTLPDRPSERGMRPAEIKKAFWSPMLDDENSILAEINRIVGEINAVLGAFHTEYAGYADRIVDLEDYGLRTTAFIDNLESTEKLAALSANQGRILNEKILRSLASLGYDAQTGVITVKHNDGSTENIDLPLEMLSIGVEDRINEETGKLELRLIFRGPSAEADEGGETNYESNSYSSWFELDDLTTGFVKQEQLKKNVDFLLGNPTEGLEYELSEDGSYYTCLGIGSATDTDILIASMIDGIPVTAIVSNAFYQTNINSVVIPGTVKSLSNNAFKSCASLVSVTMLDGVTSIGQAAFQYCGKLTSVTLPNTLETITSYAFANCSTLPSIFIPANVTTIGDKAFNNCYAVTIYCEADSQPSGWHANWNNLNKPVIWGCISNFKGVNDLKQFAEQLNDLVNELYALNEEQQDLNEEQQDLLDFLNGEITEGLSLKTDMWDPPYFQVAGIGSATRKNIVIPRNAEHSIHGLRPVDYIQESAFASTDIERIFIHDSLIVGSNAFAGCTHLTIYCEDVSEPTSWAKDWNPNNRPVVWGWDGSGVDTLLSRLMEAKAGVGELRTSKVNVADIINNLTTNVSNKPLSAAQGVELASRISTHNTATDAHGDIRQLITGLTQRLNSLANSDDTTLDQMSEVVAYIKANKGLIDSITTSKVSVADIINNLTTNVSNKPLSAAQGVELKKQIDDVNTNMTSTVASKVQEVVPSVVEEAVGERLPGLVEKGIENKVERIVNPTSNMAYVAQMPDPETGEERGDIGYPIAQHDLAHSIVQRTAYGQIKTRLMPEADTHVTSKYYVDSRGRYLHCITIIVYTEDTQGNIKGSVRLPLQLRTDSADAYTYNNFPYEIFITDSSNESTVWCEVVCTDTAITDNSGVTLNPAMTWIDGAVIIADGDDDGSPGRVYFQAYSDLLRYWSSYQVRDRVVDLQLTKNIVTM